MMLISLNIALPKTVIINDRPVLTGIYKQPVQDAVWLNKLGFNGDDQADKTVHGGEHQAIYSYPLEHYDYWKAAQQLSNLPHGTFGENLTTTGLQEDTVHIGDILKIGEATVQVTMPRIPCFKFGYKIGRPTILEPFLKSGRSGFYQRVLTEGYVKVGDNITLIDRPNNSISVRTALILQKLDLTLASQDPKKLLQQALQIPSLAPLLRLVYEERLSELG
jgi:MOSC domain-containing protein YiiM